MTTKNLESTKAKRILVTGGCGFIGSHLVEELLRDTTIKSVVVVDNFSSGSRNNISIIKDTRLKLYSADVKNEQAIRKILMENDIQMVCHLAVSPLVASISNPTEVIDNIVSMQKTVLECMRHGLFQKLISFSTSEVYGANDGSALNEDSRMNPQTPYAAAKAAADLLTMSYRQTFPNFINYTIVRPFNNYGPRKRVLKGAGIIPQTIRALKEGREINLYANGLTARDYVYVTDTARAVKLLIDNYELSKQRIYVIASGQSHTMSDIVADIGQIMNTTPKIKYDGVRSGDIQKLLGNGSLLEREMNFAPQVAWQDGLRHCVEYYIDHDIDL